jgi:hypothetical protein
MTEDNRVPIILTGDTAKCSFCERDTNTYLQNLADPTQPPAPICGVCNALCEPIKPPEKFSAN